MNMVKDIAMTSNLPFCVRYCHAYRNRLEIVGSHIGLSDSCMAGTAGWGMCLHTREERDRLWTEKEALNALKRNAK